MTREVRPIVSVLIECKGRTYRVIDNLREFLGDETSRVAAEAKIGRKILDPARRLDANGQYDETEEAPMAERNHGAPPAAPNLVKHMVDRFLGWRLPENFNPDAGISFKREFNEHTPWPMKHEPTGTNLLDANQAEEMVRYMLEGTPPAEAPAPAAESSDREREWSNALAAKILTWAETNTLFDATARCHLASVLRAEFAAVRASQTADEIVEAVRSEALKACDYAGRLRLCCRDCVESFTRVLRGTFAVRSSAPTLTAEDVESMIRSALSFTDSQNPSQVSLSYLRMAERGNAILAAKSQSVR